MQISSAVPTAVQQRKQHQVRIKGRNEHSDTRGAEHCNVSEDFETYFPAKIFKPETPAQELSCKTPHVSSEGDTSLSGLSLAASWQ